MSTARAKASTSTMTPMTTDACRRPLAAAALALVACAPGPPPETEPQAESWSVTAWGEVYEIFPEVDALAAGRPATAHTHVTVLDGFEPLTEGTVEIVFSGGDGESVFRAAEPVRPGIFAVELAPETPGEFELFFRVASAHGDEEIRGGKVRVGTSEAPAGVTVAPAPRGATDGGEPLPFLKEEQWRADFATAWVRRGRLAEAVEGFARVRTPAGGEATVTAPVDAVLEARPWPFRGQRVDRGAPLFRLVPRVAVERSLASLEAEAASLGSELGTARARLERLESLLTLEAASLRETEEARTRVASLEARSGAARRDLEIARAAREGGSAGAVTLKAPFSGEIAAVTGSPGAAVAVGTSLARLVRREPLWLEVALAPEAARRLDGGVAGLVLTFAESPALDLDGERVRLVAVAPEIEAATGTVAALLEVSGAGDELVLGTVVDAQILLAGELEGVVVPAAALVDDGGVPVVYLQLSGERFARQPVRVASRQGERVLVEGLNPGQRLVARGGEAIRRSSLMASGQAHGHVH